MGRLGLGKSGSWRWIGINNDVVWALSRGGICAWIGVIGPKSVRETVWSLSGEVIGRICGYSKRVSGVPIGISKLSSHARTRTLRRLPKRASRFMKRFDTSRLWVRAFKMIWILNSVKFN